jgi:hypothetical protein
MALRTGNKVSTGPEVLLKQINSLNPELHMENWKVLNSRDKPTDRKLILLKDQDSANITKRTSYKIFTQMSEGTFKVLSDPEKEPGGGWTSEGRTQAVSTGTKGKGVADSTSSEAHEKQPGDDPYGG